MAEIISVRTVYNLRLPDSGKEWLAAAVKSHPEPHTVVFSDGTAGSADMIGKIMQALKFGEGDYLLVDVTRQQGLRARHLFSRWASLKNCLLFGVPARDAGLQLQLNVNEAVQANGRRLLACESPAKLEGNSTLKRVLWETIQKFYGR